MHIATGARRADLGLNRLTPEVKDYIAELEIELDRLQRRSKAHRQNLRSTQDKLRVYHLLDVANAAMRAKTAADEATARPRRVTTIRKVM